MVDTKEKLAQAFIELTSELPYMKITVQKIAEKAGMNRQNYYYHFKDKQELASWIYEETSIHFLRKQDITLENWEEQVLKFLQGVKSCEGFYYESVNDSPDLLKNNFLPAAQGQFYQLFTSMDTDEILTHQDKEFYAQFFSYGCYGLLIHWIHSRFEDTPLEIAMRLYRLAKDTEWYSYRLLKNDMEYGDFEDLH
ncbi:MAG: TetR/AcrR family transcriptional regulator C-terminal domain-containing protein [Lactobacillales bacterium]|jgi:AcrR family transcriptional regulator|nr:TetR/AcrR family transcriptional regulator C-terminal domain-containing protein [Lactobacillales bacterium]